MVHSRNGSRVFLSACAGVVLAAGCSSRGVPSPDAVVSRFYQTVIRSGVTGAPTRKQLADLAPFLTTELHDLLQDARGLSEREAAVHPDEKPPFVEGDLFSSLFEGPTDLTIEASAEGGSRRLVAVRLMDVRLTPTVSWTDTIVVREEGGRLVIADIRYGGTWDFAKRGSLVASLRATLSPDSMTAGGTATSWLVSADGIGIVRIGMRVSEVVTLLGGTVDVARVEPGEACADARFSAVPPRVSFMLSADTIVRIDVHTVGVRTIDGVGVGDREADLAARFGRRLRVEPHPYEGPEGHYLVLDDLEVPNRRMIFETDGRVVTRFRGGRLPEVDYIEGCL